MFARLTVDFSALPVWVNGLVVVVAIVIIAFSAHWLVESAVALAERLGISELVIGLTIVALGTSAPEFAVTLNAAFKGQGNISVGNIVGSNIFNLGFILGGAALFRAVPTNRILLTRDGSVLIGTTLLLAALIGIDLRLGRADGVLLLGLLGAYLFVLFRMRRSGDDSDGAHEPVVVQEEPRHSPLGRSFVFLVVGFVGVGLGSHYMVDAATAIARAYHVSEWVIGVTILAAGTSAPEFATTLAGVMKGRYDVGTGNLIGSDIFNLLGVLGLAGVLQPVGVDPIARLSLAALVGMVAMALIFMRTGWKISRLEGGLLVLVALGRWILDFTTRASG